MRIADTEHEAEVLAAVCPMLRASGFVFRDDCARTLSGKEEEAYDWLHQQFGTHQSNLKNAPKFSIKNEVMVTLNG